MINLIYHLYCCCFCCCSYKQTNVHLMYKNYNVFPPKSNKNQIKIHPKIDSILNENYHIDYTYLYQEALLHPYYNQTLKQFFKMAGAKTTPPLNSIGQCSQSAVDVINSRFVTTALQGGQTPQNADANLVGQLRKALVEAEFDREEIEHTLAQFDPTLSVHQYFNVINNIHVVKSKGNLSIY